MSRLQVIISAGAVGDTIRKSPYAGTVETNSSGMTSASPAGAEDEALLLLSDAAEVPVVSEFGVEPIGVDEFKPHGAGEEPALAIMAKLGVGSGDGAGVGGVVAFKAAKGDAEIGGSKGAGEIPVAEGEGIGGEVDVVVHVEDGGGTSFDSETAGAVAVSGGAEAGGVTGGMDSESGEGGDEGFVGGRGGGFEGVEESPAGRVGGYDMLKRLTQKVRAIEDGGADGFHR